MADTTSSSPASLDFNAVQFALRKVISDLDYDTYKYIEWPEDEDDDEGDSFEDWAVKFQVAYAQGLADGGTGAPE